MILLVEDNELIQQLVGELCADAGIELVVATRCRDAIAELLAHRDAVRLVLMDFNLDGPRTGITCAVKIRTELPEPLSGLPIVAVTGGLYPEDAEIIESARFQKIIQKPFRLEELREVIDLYVPQECRSR